MATDVRGLFGSNRRREVNAVTCTLPYVIGSEDIREGIAEVVLASGDYTVLTIPGNVILNTLSLVVPPGATFGVGSTATVLVDGSVELPDGAIDSEGLDVAATMPMYLSSPSDIVIRLALAGTSTEAACVKLIMEFIDFDRATMDYIGEA